MNIFRLCEDMFESMPNKINIKEFFKEKAAEMGDSRKAFYTMIDWIGGRSYNQFLDYGLFALKFIQICREKEFYWDIKEWEPVREAVSYLLFDDRHDVGGNAGSRIGKVGGQLNDEKQVHFYDLLTTALIECINVNGTEDQAYKFTIKEE